MNRILLLLALALQAVAMPFATAASGRIDGVVLWDDGHGVPGTTVSLCSPSTMPIATEIISSGQGVFSFIVPMSSDYFLFAELPGLGRSGTHRAVVGDEALARPELLIHSCKHTARTLYIPFDSPGLTCTLVPTAKHYSVGSTPMVRPRVTNHRPTPILLIHSEAGYPSRAHFPLVDATVQGPEGGFKEIPPACGPGPQIRRSHFVELAPGDSFYPVDESLGLFLGTLADPGTFQLEFSYSTRHVDILALDLVAGEEAAIEALVNRVERIGVSCSLSIAVTP